jgi:hypothetical protein
MQYFDWKQVDFIQIYYKFTANQTKKYNVGESVHRGIKEIVLV